MSQNTQSTPSSAATYPAALHGALVRQILDLDADNSAHQDAAKGIVTRLMELIEHRIPIEYEPVLDYGSVPVESVVTANNHRAMGKLGRLDPLLLGMAETRALLVAYGQAGYFDVNDANVRIYSRSTNANCILGQSIALDCIPMALACIDLGASTDNIPSYRTSEVHDFTTFLYAQCGEGSEAATLIMDALMERSIARAKAQHLESGSGPEAEAPHNPLGISCPQAPVTRRRRVGI